MQKMVTGYQIDFGKFWARTQNMKNLNYNQIFRSLAVLGFFPKDQCILELSDKTQSQAQITLLVLALSALWLSKF